MRPADAGLRALVRLLLGGLSAGGLALVFQAALIARLLPLLQAWLGVIDESFRTLDLRTLAMNGELMIVRVATPALTQVLGTHVIVPDPGNLMSTSVSAGIVLQPLVLAAALLLAWPWQRPAEFAARAVLVLPLLLAVLALDVPMMLYGLLWYQEVAALEPERFSLLILWADFMNAGGRYALTLVAVALAAKGARRILPTRPSPVPPGPPATALPAGPPSRPAGRAA